MVRVRCAVATVGMLIAAASVHAFPGGVDFRLNGSPASGGSTCFACHSDGGAGSGSLDLLGRPTRYIPDRVYDLTVRVFDPGQMGAGFQLTVETPLGDSVGELIATDPVNTRIPMSDAGILTHTEAGYEDTVSNWASGGGQGEYTLQWRAPATDMGDIAIYLAANATNNNNSTSGDIIYADSFALTFAGCLGDISGDGVVDGVDIARVLNDFGANAVDSDLNGDGTVDGVDLAFVLNDFGPCP